MAKPDGGAAFPRPMSDVVVNQPDFGAPGMTLRDWFAGQALVGTLAARFRLADDAEKVAEIGYDIADAMLAERDKGDMEDPT